MPLDGAVPEQWRAAVVDDKGRVERIPYELCVLVALRDALRRREIRVVGASRWRNPEDDLPADLKGNRDVHYAAIRQPQDPEKFIEALQRRLREALTRFDTALELGTTGGVAIVSPDTRRMIFPRAPEELPAGALADRDHSQRQPLYRCSDRRFVHCEGGRP